MTMVIKIASLATFALYVVGITVMTLYILVGFSTIALWPSVGLGLVVLVCAVYILWRLRSLVRELTNTGS